ncbi:HIT-like protein [Byssothecium circinans]|uniref:Aprataxin-like protein n=1 Tax=Byssothecium circinans TaxID=147558 RepID=A0A6A5TLK1_9PLEO|nr:HIT-like protein [Byssothecium circinans]
MASPDLPRAPSPNADPLTSEELRGTAASNKPQPANDASSIKRPNAFTELMSSAKKQKPTSAPITAEDAPKPSKKEQQEEGAWKTYVGRYGLGAWKTHVGRYGLGAYIEHPERNPDGRVIDYDDEFVVINDKYPKASVHLLLLPRSPEYYKQHPLHLLSTDPTFLSKVRSRVAHIKTLAASELRRQYSAHSTSDAPRRAAIEQIMSSPDAPSSPSEITAPLPAGRDWEAELIAGVHTHPSMNHLHIHVMSREMASPWVKHKKHYLSFQTSFMVQLEEFPLEEGSARFHPGNWPDWDMVCWRCGRNFRQKFAELKRHLGEEFEVWKRE